jgi:hypothetical protein
MNLEKISELVKPILLPILILKDKVDKILKSDSLKTLKPNKRYIKALRTINEHRGKFTIRILESLVLFIF